MYILPGYRGTYIRGVRTFGALQPTANFSKNWRGTYFRRGTYLRGFTVVSLETAVLLRHVWLYWSELLIVLLLRSRDSFEVGSHVKRTLPTVQKETFLRALWSSVVHLQVVWTSSQSSVWISMTSSDQECLLTGVQSLLLTVVHTSPDSLCKNSGKTGSFFGYLDSTGILSKYNHRFFFSFSTLQYIIKNQIKKCKCAQRKKTNNTYTTENKGKKLCLKDWIMYACVYDNHRSSYM